MKTKSLVLPFLLLSAACALAKPTQVPNAESPAASLTFPDSWTQNKIEGGVEANSADNAVYMSVVVVDNKDDMDAEIDNVFEMLKERKVELDESSKKENKFKIGGMDAEELLFQGKDEDGPTAVSITFVPLKDKVLVITYWVAPEEEAKHTDDIKKIVQSIKVL